MDVIVVKKHQRIVLIKATRGTTTLFVQVSIIFMKKESTRRKTNK